MQTKTLPTYEWKPKHNRISEFELYLCVSKLFYIKLQSKPMDMESGVAKAGNWIVKCGDLMTNNVENIKMKFIPFNDVKWI